MPVEFKDYDAVLGVPRTASPEEIKNAFRKLAREYHPDIARDKQTAEQKFEERALWEQLRRVSRFNPRNGSEPTRG